MKQFHWLNPQNLKMQDNVQFETEFTILYVFMERDDENKFGIIDLNLTIYNAQNIRDDEMEDQTKGLMHITNHGILQKAN